MNRYQRVFGSGPAGSSISVLLLAVAVFLEGGLGQLRITDSDGLRYAVFAVLSAVTLLVILWSFTSLPPADRGHKLVTTGAFKYFRHPLYGAVLSFFNFGLAMLLNNWIYVLWALIQHPVWHWVIRGEEQLMEQAFPGEYEEYALATGRFFPRIRA